MDTNSALTSLTIQCQNQAYGEDLLKSGSFHDCIVKCGNRSWKAHRNILCPRCSFFQACFDGRFDESNRREVNLNEDQPEAVQGLLYYIYTLGYPRHLCAQPSRASNDSNGSIDKIAGIDDGYRLCSFDLMMYLIADKYNLEGLMGLAQESLRNVSNQVAQGSPNTFVENLDGFTTFISELYTPDASIGLENLRAEVINTISSLLAAQIRDDRVLELISTIPEFAVDFVEALRPSKSRQNFVESVESRGSPRLAYIPMNEDSDCE